MADRAVLPIENSLGGSIHAVYDLLLRYKMHIVGEVGVPVNHCLLALPGVSLGMGGGGAGAGLLLLLLLLPLLLLLLLLHRFHTYPPRGAPRAQVRREDIRRVMSHPQALAQTDNYTRRMPGVVREAVDDTAGAAKMIAENGWRDAAAGGSRRAGAVCCGGEAPPHPPPTSAGQAVQPSV